MRDFIDRLAARAVGGESMLSPRLPSLFESAQAASPAPIEEARVVTVPSSSVSNATVPSAEPRRSTQPLPSGLAALPIVREALAKPLESPVVSPGAARMEAALTATHAHFHVAESPGHSIVSPVPERAPRVDADKQAIVLRERLLEVQTVTHDRRAVDEGVLLTPSNPVFRTPSPSSPAVVSHAATRANHPSPTSPGTNEPIVHVSIGRLEVRAAPETGKNAVRRQAAPQASPLDDYLRQRSKASP